MRGLRIGLVGAASLFVLFAPACRARAPQPVTTQRASEPPVDPHAFDHSTSIDNQWLPLQPGTQFVYQGSVHEDHRRLSHRVVFTVTDLTKMINGVRTRVIWDRDYTEGDLVEGELAFFAQDNGGTVWALGEYPEEYEEGKFAGAPDTWIAGLADARAGVAMQGQPQVGTPSYLQGYAPDIDFADRARVYQTGLSDCIPVNCYQNVLVTDEWNPSEPGPHQRKYYAPGVGNIRVGAVGGGEHEGLVLINIVHLSPEGLAEVRDEALKLEERAYLASADLYGHTSPAEHPILAGQSP